MIEAALTRFLLADAQVSRLIGRRCWPFRAPQAKDMTRATFPRIIHQRIATTRLRTNDGPTGLTKAIIQLGFWALGKGGGETAKELADVVRLAKGGDQGKPLDPKFAALDGFKGTMAGVVVQGAFLDDDADSDEGPVHGDDAAAYQVTADLTIWFEETRT